MDTPVERKHVHTRQVSYQAFLRADGLWDFDCRLIDQRPEDFQLPHGKLVPGQTPLHNIAVRVTVDDKSMEIKAASADLDQAPYSICQGVRNSVDNIVGLRIGSGWRKAVQENIGGVAGCTHIRELLGGLATAVFQTVMPYREDLMRNGVLPRPDVPPQIALINSCFAYAEDSPVSKAFLADVKKTD